MRVFLWWMCASCGQRVRVPGRADGVCLAVAGAASRHRPTVLNGLSGMYVNDQHVWVP